MYNISKKTAQQIVDTVKEFCGYDINFISDSGMILASTDSSRIGTFHEGGMAALRSGEALEVFQNDTFHGTQKGVNIPVFQGNIPAAVIGISGDPDEVRPFAHLAERITRLLLREQELNAAVRTSSEKRHYLIQSLINESTENPRYLLSLLKDFRMNPNTSKRIILIHLKSENGGRYMTNIESRIQLLCDKLTGSIFCYQYPYDFILLTDAKCVDEKLSILRKFASEERDSLAVGIGQSCDLYQVHTSFAAAQIALESLSFSDSNLSLFDDLTLEILLGPVSKECRKKYLDKTIQALSSEEILLLRLYFEENRSLTQTAKRLFLHKNTLQYRLERIHKHCGFDPRNFKDAVILYLAVNLENRNSYL